MKIVNKLLDSLAGFCDTCRNLTYSKKVDIVSEINGKDPNGIHYTYRKNGGYSVNLIKLIVGVCAYFTALLTFSAIFVRGDRSKKRKGKERESDQGAL